MDVTIYQNQQKKMVSYDKYVEKPKYSLFYLAYKLVLKMIKFIVSLINMYLSPKDGSFCL